MTTEIDISIVHELGEEQSRSKLVQLFSKQEVPTEVIDNYWERYGPTVGDSRV